MHVVMAGVVLLTRGDVGSMAGILSCEACSALNGRQRKETDVVILHHTSHSSGHSSSHGKGTQKKPKRKSRQVDRK